MHQGGGDLRALLVAEGERLDRVVQALAEAELGEQRLAARGGVGLAEAVQPGQVDHLLEHLHLRVQPALLGHVAEVPAVRVGDGAAVQQHGAAVRGEHAEHDAHGGGLAGAVAADEAGEPARDDLERDVVENPPRAVALRDAGEIEKARKGGDPGEHCGHVSTVFRGCVARTSPARGILAGLRRSACGGAVPRRRVCGAAVLRCCGLAVCGGARACSRREHTLFG